MKNISLLFIISTIFLILSCEKDDSSDDLGGDPSLIGEVGNVFYVSGFPYGVSNTSIKITDRKDGVSTITLSGALNNSNLEDLLQTIDGYEGQTTISAKFKVTSEGIESVYDDGKFLLVKYSAKVGDTYTYNRKGMSLKREVTDVTNKDDYYWNGMLIKTIKVKETGRNIPGLRNAEFVFNHKFGLVGYKLNLEDGSKLDLAVLSNQYDAH